MIISPAHRTESVQEYYFSRKLKEIASMNAAREAAGEEPVINQTQNEVAFICGLIASVIKTLATESPVFATVLKNFVRQRWFHRMLGKASDERMVFGFYCIVTMINCD